MTTVIDDSNNVNHVIDNLRLCVDLEGDGGFTSFTTKEKEEMYKFLSSLQSESVKHIKNI